MIKTFQTETKYCSKTQQIKTFQSLFKDNFFVKMVQIRVNKKIFNFTIYPVIESLLYICTYLRVHRFPYGRGITFSCNWGCRHDIRVLYHHDTHSDCMVMQVSVSIPEQSSIIYIFTKICEYPICYKGGQANQSIMSCLRTYYI